MFQPVIEDDRCTNCRECAKVCPKDVLDTDEGDVRVMNPHFCTGCESCQAVCPVKAIEVHEV